MLDNLKCGNYYYFVVEMDKGVFFFDDNINGEW